MLRKLKVKGFRLLEDVEIEFQEGAPIVLIGPNGSGKTSIVEVLDLLSMAAVQGLEAAIYQQRGGFDLIRTIGRAEPLELDLWMNVGPGAPHGLQQEALLHYGFALEGTAPPYFRVIRENLDLDAGPPGPSSDEARGLKTIGELMESNGSRASGMGIGSTVFLRRDATKVEIRNESRREMETFEPGPTNLALTALRQNVGYPTLAAAANLLANSRLYPGFHTLPSWARDPRESGPSPRDPSMLMSTRRLDRRGFDLVNVLYHMRTNDEAGWSDLLQIYTEEFPTITKLEFPPLETPGRVALRVHDRRFGELQALQLSDGQIELLAVLAATLATPSPASPAPAVLAFDEPDAHFHPSLMKRLVSVLERAAERTAVVVATHSDRFLDFLSDPATSVRVLEAKGNGTCVRRLDSSTLDAWREHYTVSELRARGQLDPANSERDPAR